MSNSILIGGNVLGKKLEDLAKKMAVSVSVGFLGDTTYPNGTNVATVAFWQEFGTKSIHNPRPFFRTMINANRDSWGKMTASIAKGTNFDWPKVMATMGNEIKGELEESIRELVEPELSPVTLMLRKMQEGHMDDPNFVTGKMVGEAAARVAAGESYADAPTKPLVWTGRLLASVDYKVNK